MQKKFPVKYEIHFQDDEHTCRIPKIAGLGAGPASGASLRQDPGPGPSLRHSLRFLERNVCQDFFPIRLVPCQRISINLSYVRISERVEDRCSLFTFGGALLLSGITGAFTRDRKIARRSENN